MNAILHPVWDLMLYLGILQVGLLVVLYRIREESNTLSLSVVALIAGTLLAVFWLVWGGYSIDAWRNLMRFDNPPRLIESEQLYWGAGYLLGNLLKDPWPLKVMSALGCSILILSYRIAAQDARSLLASIVILICLPGFLLLFGNAVRQGIAGSLIVLACAVWVSGSRYRAIPAFIIAPFFHLVSIVPVIAVISAPWLRRYLLPLLLISYLVSPTTKLLAEATGFNLDRLVRYASYQEGQLHYMKAAISGFFALTLLLSLRRDPSEDTSFRELYVLLVAAANCLLIYEVPFERMLLFSDLLLPLAVVEAVSRTNIATMALPVVGAGFASMGMLVWASASIMHAMGYATG